MPRKVAPLTQKQILNAKPKDKDYTLSDGDGLQLRMRANGTRQWNFQYTHPYTKKRVNISLGTFPTVSLKLARDLAAKNRELVAQDIDPKEYRKQQIIAEQSLNKHTLLNVASEWIEMKKHEISDDHAQDIWRSLELHIFPDIGNYPISKITAQKAIEQLKPIEAKGSLETVKRLCQRLNEIMDYAVNSGILEANSLSAIHKTFKKPQKRNMASLPPTELPRLMSAIANASIKRTTRCLIEWQLHTMVRPSEAAGTRWEEINIDEHVWTIPAERMKSKREHRVPLSDQTIALLETIKPISGHREYVFPADRDPKRPCNSQTANAALKRMGFQGILVSHGLRSLASTTLNEKDFDSDVIEAALAHVDANQVRSAYNRTDYFERRRALMSAWSKHIEEASQGSISLASTKHLSVVA